MNFLILNQSICYGTETCVVSESFVRRGPTPDVFFFFFFFFFVFLDDGGERLQTSLLAGHYQPRMKCHLNGVSLASQ